MYMKMYMKKFAWILSAVVGLLLTSCLENEGYSYTGTFCRVVTIDHESNPPRFICDYTGEVYVCDNINQDSDLGPFDLKNAKRALAYFSYQADLNESIISLSQGCAPIEVTDLWCQSLPKDKTYNPVFGFTRMQVESGWEYPYAWVSQGYLNIVPIAYSDEAVVPYLAPAGVGGDTLKFNLYLSHERGNNYRSQYMCFDLRQLKDTANAEPKFRPWMKDMTDLIKQKDSVVVCVWADYQASDTLKKVTIPTSHFSFSLND